MGTFMKDINMARDMEDDVQRDEESSLEDTIKQNLQAFLPYICDCVTATDLLAGLFYYTKEQRKEIFQLSMSKSQSATRKALDILMADIHEPGKYTALKECIEQCNYPKIAEILIGKHVPNDENCQKIVDLFSMELIARLTPSELLPLLRHHDVVQFDECDLIRAEEKNHGQRRACWLMLYYLPCRQKNWFRYFLLTLMEYKFEDLAKKLDPDLYEKLVAQQRARDAEGTDESMEQEDQSLVYGAGLPSNIKVNTVSDHQSAEQDEDKTMPDAEFNKIICDIDEIVERADLEETKERTDETGVKEVLEDFSFLLENEGDEGMAPVNGVQERDGKTVIKYTREFLLDLQNSPFAQYTPLEASKFPEITLPLLRKRKSPDRILNAQDLPVKQQILGVVPAKPIASMASSGEQTEVKQAANDNTELKQIYDDREGARQTVNEAHAAGEDEPAVDGVARNTNGALESAAPIVETVADLDIQHTEGDREATPENLHVDSASENLNDDLEDDFKKLLLKDLKGQNDLSADSTRDEDQMDDFNIKTDEDQLDTEDKDIELRNYQKELAREGREGDNVIVMAPTNSGKTRVGCAIIQSHLRKRRQSGQIGRVVFIVENEALAHQQGKVFEVQLPAYRTKVITGSIQRDKKQYLKDFVDRRDILVVTAMVLVNTLQEGEIGSLSEFTMIMLDECHHTNGCHPYNQIMSKYMDIKLNKNMDPADLPQIVGLTASIGVGGSLAEETAKNHMRKIMANMDAAYLCTVRQNLAELKKHENPPIERTVTVRPRKDDVFRGKLVKCIQAIDGLIAGHPALDKKFADLVRVPPPHLFGTEQFIQWLSDFKKTIAKFGSKDVIRMLNPCREHLQVYNKSLMIHRDARVKEARDVLEIYMLEQINENPVKDDTDNKLLDIYNSVNEIEYDNIPENPKLIKLQELMMGVLSNDPNARGIIFVKTRELARALINWTKATPDLAPLNADYFVGAVASASVGGMTKCGQKDVLEYFKDGKHKLLIATSVAEEGLDIAKCNLVIRYEHVTNEIVRLQSRGRARAEDSKYFVLTEVGSWIAEKEEKNQRMEVLMNELVPIVQREIETSQQRWQREMKDMQKEEKEKERQKERERQEKQDAGRWQLQCMNCTKFICWSTGVKQIQNAHHVVIDHEVKERIVTRRNPFPKFEESELKFDGDIFCLECAYRLGGVCEYKRVEFPLLQVKNLRLAYENNAHGMTEKKWKKVPFYIEKFTLDDLTVIAERKFEEFGDDI